MTFNRRKFIGGLAALPLLYSFKNMGIMPDKDLFSEQNIPIKPKKLEKGDTVGLITPGGFIRKEQLERTLEEVKEFGFIPYYTNSVLSREGYLAGTDKERAEELMQMFLNPAVDAILCVRGGYGCNLILDLLDYNAIKNNPKALIGYSDITSLFVAIYQKTGLVCFHGPVGISDFNDYTLKYCQKVLMKSKSKLKYHYQRQAITEGNPEFDLYTIQQGKAEGRLIGGNLSLLSSLAGTQYSPDFKGKIVFIEEVKEKTYRVDRMITQLVMGTNLKEAAGIVLGIFKKCDIDGFITTTEDSFTLKEMLLKRLTPLKIPTFYGFPFGHVSNKITLPVGILAKINAKKCTIKLMENGVV